jgi:threonine synthase
MTTLTHLECSRCGSAYDPAAGRGLCACGGPLLARYDLDAARTGWSRDWIANAPATMWRYAPVLPVRKPPSIVSLGEGMTPLIHARRLGERLGAAGLWIKDEGLNPTGSLKARGFSCAVSMAVELGIPKVAVRSGGNAASALAAYAAAAAIEAQVFLPGDAPSSNYVECRTYGARVERAGRPMAPAEGWFDLGVFQEPYRIEGSKTLGYEIAEQLSWTLPDAIVCPVGEGLGLIGAWKAFEELEQLAWTVAKRPRMIAVQAEGCQPIVQAFAEGTPRVRRFENARTLAAGLRVPEPSGDSLILGILRESGGAAVAVSDREIVDAGLELAALEGIFAAPEGAAAIAALPKLLADGRLKRDERIVICNTGSGLKNPEAYMTRFPHAAAGEQDKLGGLITPR